jgi:hypothetical protein
VDNLFDIYHACTIIYIRELAQWYVDNLTRKKKKHMTAQYLQDKWNAERLVSINDFEENYKPTGRMIRESEYVLIQTYEDRDGKLWRVCGKSMFGLSLEPVIN